MIIVLDCDMGSFDVHAAVLILFLLGAAQDEAACPLRKIFWLVWLKVTQLLSRHTQTLAIQEGILYSTALGNLSTNPLTIWAWASDIKPQFGKP